MATLDDLLAEAKPRETTVQVCLDGTLLAAHESAEEELRAAVAGGVEVDSLSGVHPAVALAARVQDLEQQIRDKARAFRFRALGAYQYRALVDAHPSDQPRLRFNLATFAPALIAACCVEPVTFADAAEVGRLAERVGEGVMDQLFDAAFRCNEGGGDIPKSATVSAVTRTTGPSSTPPPAGE